MLNRLNFELAERQRCNFLLFLSYRSTQPSLHRLDQRRKELVQQKEELLKENKTKLATMDSVKAHIDALMKVNLPLNLPIIKAYAFYRLRRKHRRKLMNSSYRLRSRVPTLPPLSYSLYFQGYYVCFYISWLSTIQLYHTNDKKPSVRVRSSRQEYKKLSHNRKEGRREEKPCDECGVNQQDGDVGSDKITIMMQRWSRMKSVGGEGLKSGQPERRSNRMRPNARSKMVEYMTDTRGSSRSMSESSVQIHSLSLILPMSLISSSSSLSSLPSAASTASLVANRWTYSIYPRQLTYRKAKFKDNAPLTLASYSFGWRISNAAASPLRGSLGFG